MLGLAGESPGVTIPGMGKTLGVFGLGVAGGVLVAVAALGSGCLIAPVQADDATSSACPAAGEVSYSLPGSDPTTLASLTVLISRRSAESPPRTIVQPPDPARVRFSDDGVATVGCNPGTVVLFVRR